jgi:hypothetical protein
MEKNRCNAKKRSKKIYGIPDHTRRQSEFHQAVVEVMCLISLHRILPSHHPNPYYIYEVDEIDSEHRHRCGDLASCDDRECRDQKSEHDRTTISHESSPRDIQTCNRQGHRYDDREYDEKEVTILYCSGRCIEEE